MNEWVCLGNNENGIYTEVMNLGCIGLLRTYNWDSHKDEPSNLCVIEIDTQSAALLIRSHSEINEEK